MVHGLGVIQLLIRNNFTTGQVYLKVIEQEREGKYLGKTVQVVPHITEELWQRMGNAVPLSDTGWPEYDRDAVVDEELTVVVQVNGKLRSKITCAADTSEEELKAFALADEKIAPFIEGKTVRKVICVQGKLVNIVVG